jgi:hypothetical protein
VRDGEIGRQVEGGRLGGRRRRVIGWEMDVNEICYVYLASFRNCDMFSAVVEITHRRGTD